MNDTSSQELASIKPEIENNIEDWGLDCGYELDRLITKYDFFFNSEKAKEEFREELNEKARYFRPKNPKKFIEDLADFYNLYRGAKGVIPPFHVQSKIPQAFENAEKRLDFIEDLIHNFLSGNLTDQNATEEQKPYIPSLIAMRNLIDDI